MGQYPNHSRSRRGPPLLEQEHIQLIDKVKHTLAPEDDVEITTTPTLDTHTLRVMSKLHHPELWPAKKEESQQYEEADITTKIIKRFINAIQSKDTAPEEQALGFFTKKKPKTLLT